LVGKKQKSLYQILMDFRVIIFLFCLVCFSGVSSSSATIIKRDIDNDGCIDQVAYVGEGGEIIRLELYDADNRLTAVQYYENDSLLKVVKDTDEDRVFDVTDYFKEGKRIRQEKITPQGVVMNCIVFDENEKILEIRKDTDGNGSFDQHYCYVAGILTSSTSDDNGDGNVNVWNTYQDKQLTYRKIDKNGDGLPEKEIFYNQKKESVKSFHDLDIDGYLETYREYSCGQLVTETKDLNQDKAFDLTIAYKNGIKYL